MRILLLGNSYINEDILNQYLENKHVFTIVSSDFANEKILDLIREVSIDILIFNSEIDINDASELLKNIKKNHSWVSTILISTYENLKIIDKYEIEGLIDDFMTVPIDFIEFSMRIRKIIKQTVEANKKQVLYPKVFTSDIHNIEDTEDTAQEKEQELCSQELCSIEAHSIELADDSEEVLDVIETSEAAEKVEIVEIEEPVLHQENLEQVIQERKKDESQVKDSFFKKPVLLRAADITGKVVFGILITVIGVLAFFLIQSKIAGGTPSIAGRQIYMALSGSMSPTFDTGSLVFVTPVKPSEIIEGDIITFRGNSVNSALTTHRVVEINRKDGLSFTTKGDANNVEDPNPVLPDRVVGKVCGHIPYLGYLMGFAQTKQGLILLVFIPGILIIIYELKNIFKIAQEMREDKSKEMGA
jgi:signal peptidase